LDGDLVDELQPHGKVKIVAIHSTEIEKIR